MSNNVAKHVHKKITKTVGTETVPFYFFFINNFHPFHIVSLLSMC